MLPPAIASLAVALPCSGGPYTSCTAPWQHAGPAGYHGLDKSDDDPKLILSAGAAQMVVSDLDGHGTWFLGSVNGGVWRSSNVSTASPHWAPITDQASVPCSSISALATAPGGIVLAGCGGSTSSEMGTDWNSVNSGAWGGVMRSADGGTTWAALPAFPVNYYVSAIAVPNAAEEDGLDYVILVAARSHFYDRNDGGIWRSADGGLTFTRVLSTPVFNLLVADASTVLAAVPFPAHLDEAIIQSTDGGRSFVKPIGAGLSFGEGHAPFYPCLALGGAHLYYGALTVDANDTVKTNSVVYRRAWPLKAGSGWVAIPSGPDPHGHGLDDDAMPKDRMALLPHPHDPTMLFVAGNGDKIAYRVHLDDTPGGRIDAVWTSMAGEDASNGAAPHCDCRNFAWDPASGSLLLVSDGGIFRRTEPERPGGKWLSANGNYGGMEFLSASWDWRAERWVAGAQDNDVQVAPPNARPTDVATGIVLGDGMATAVDASVSPSRLWGTRQFLGSRRGEVRRRLDDTDDDFMPGFCFSRGDATNKTNRACLDTASWGFTPEAFPFFYHPFALSAHDSSLLVTWTRAAAGQPAGFWQLQVPSHAAHASDMPAPSFVASTGGADVYELFAGGVVGGVVDATLLLGLNNTHLHIVSTALTHGRLEARPLPVAYASPLILKYDPVTHQPIIGPVSHGKTVSMAVSRTDAATLAVTGRPSVLTNRGDESVWLTRDAGKTWINATGNLRAATQAVGQTRPSALELVDVDGKSALLVGTVSGVYVTWTTDTWLGVWSRLGTCAELPLVLTMGLSYEPHSDTLVAATFGRGVFVLRGTKAALATAAAQHALELGVLVGKEA